jgi:hypothetical protein
LTSVPTPLDRLSPAEARRVLLDLVSSHADVGALAAKIAWVVLKDVSAGDVADRVQRAILDLDLDDLDGGPTPFGYVEPVDAASEVLEERIKPFIEDLQRYVELGLEQEALEVCKGILVGLYRCRDLEGHEVLEHAPDFAVHAAGDALATWRRTQRVVDGRRFRRQRPDFPIGFVRSRIPEWRGLVDRVRRR